MRASAPLTDRPAPPKDPAESAGSVTSDGCGTALALVDHHRPALGGRCRRADGTARRGGPHARGHDAGPPASGPARARPVHRPPPPRRSRCRAPPAWGADPRAQRDRLADHLRHWGRQATQREQAGARGRDDQQCARGVPRGRGRSAARHRARPTPRGRADRRELPRLPAGVRRAGRRRVGGCHAGCVHLRGGRLPGGAGGLWGTPVADLGPDKAKGIERARGGAETAVRTTYKALVTPPPRTGRQSWASRAIRRSSPRRGKRSAAATPARAVTVIAPPG